MKDFLEFVVVKVTDVGRATKSGQVTRPECGGVFFILDSGRQPINVVLVPRRGSRAVRDLLAQVLITVENLTQYDWQGPAVARDMML